MTPRFEPSKTKLISGQIVYLLLTDHSVTLVSILFLQIK